MIPSSESPQATAQALLRAEVLAARIEATARAEPELGALWRAELVLAEAVASAGLEGVRIREDQLLPRVAANGGQAAEPGAAELALGLLQALKAPGDPLADPVSLLRRFERLAGAAPDPDMPRPDDATLAALFAAIRPGDMPILTAARVAAGYGRLTRRASPAVERLLFMAVEGRLRGQPGGPAPASDPLRGLSARVDAGWICPPALALSHRRFRPWSPGSPEGLAALARGLNDVLEAETGRLALAREWLRRGRALAKARRRNTRLPDALRAFAQSPVLSSGLLAEAIGVSRRGALNLIEALEAEGLLREITHRRSARIWAVPSIADRLAARPARGALGRMRGRATGGPAAVVDDIESSFAELDAAFAQTEALMPKRLRRISS